MAKSLKQMYEERRASDEFRQRDKTYDDLQRVYDSRQGRGSSDSSYRPNLQDPTTGDEAQREAEEIVVNQVRRVVNHFTAMFAYPPRVMVSPLILEEQQAKHANAGALTDYNDHVLAKSNIATMHPRVSHWLSLRGDGVYGVDWGMLGSWGSMGNLKRGVRIFTFDPRYCYPMTSRFDLGGVDDMLIALQVAPEQAREMFGLSEREVDGLADPRVFYYWTASEFRVAVEDRELEQYSRKHELGFCPFRWIFGDPSGSFGQADVREVPTLQRTFNEGLLLAIDAIRKQVDASWWYSSDETKEIHPVPGQADPLGPNAQVGRWEIAADPQIILGVMQYLEQSIQATTGVSGISMSGAAPQTSHVTGTAIRHQVEAAEARAETRKALYQGAYSRLAEYVLMVTRKMFPEEVIHFRSGAGLSKMTADQIAEYVEAEAEYGGFLGLAPEQRVEIALKGLGHLWDDEYAVGGVLDLPGVTPAVMRDRVAAYQLAQAKAQAKAQQAMQEGQQGQDGAQGPPGGPGGAGGGGGGQGASPPTMARPQRPQPPTGPQLRDHLAKQLGKNGR
jgi:hypothetical protein